MYYFYVLYSLKDQKLYKGVSSDISKRFLKHSLGGTKSTQHRRPLVLIFIEEFADKKTALQYEKFTKSAEGGTKLREKLNLLDILDRNGKLKM